MEEAQNIKRCFSISVVILLLGGVHVATSAARKGPLTQAERIEFLIAHNNFRRDAAHVLDGLKQPPAANMRKLYWSPGLEAEAVAWTARMTALHTLYYGYTGVILIQEFFEMHGMLYATTVGHNIAVGIDNATEVVDNWSREMISYSIKRNICAEKGRCRHYIQLVWAKTTYLGCAIGQKEGEVVFITCAYHGQGHIEMGAPYKVGQICTLCGVEKGDYFTECENGLCQPKDKCSPVKGCKVVDTENCLCSASDYNTIVKRLVQANGLRLAPSSLLLMLSVVVVVDLLVSPLDVD